MPKLPEFMAVAILLALTTVDARRGSVRTRGSFTLSTASISASNRAGNDELDELDQASLMEIDEIGIQTNGHCDIINDKVGAVQCNTTATNADGTPAMVNFGQSSTPLCTSCRSDCDDHYFERVHEKGGLCKHRSFWSKYFLRKNNCWLREWDMDNSLWISGRISIGETQSYSCTRTWVEPITVFDRKNIGMKHATARGKTRAYCQVHKITDCLANTKFNVSCDTASEHCEPKFKCNTKKEVKCNRMCPELKPKMRAMHETTGILNVTHYQELLEKDCEMNSDICTPEVCEQVAAYS